MTLQNKPPVGGLPPEFPPQAGGPPHQPKFPDSPYLSDVGRRIRDDILDMLPLLRKHAAESEQLGALAPATLAAVDRSGAFKITIPVELGGYALGARDAAEIVKALGQGDASAGWLVIVSSAARNALGFDQRPATKSSPASKTGLGQSCLVPPSSRQRLAMAARSTEATW